MHPIAPRPLDRRVIDAVSCNVRHAVPLLPNISSHPGTIPVFNPMLDLRKEFGAIPGQLFVAVLEIPGKSERIHFTTDIPVGWLSTADHHICHFFANPMVLPQLV